MRSSTGESANFKRKFKAQARPKPTCLAAIRNIPTALSKILLVIRVWLCSRVAVVLHDLA